MAAERPPRNQKPIPNPTPEPSDPKLFEFLARLFDGEEFCEKLELRQCWGQALRQHGPVIHDEVFKINLGKPDREKLVSISNLMRDLAQQNCDSIGRKHDYVIGAKNHVKSDTYYRHYNFNLTSHARAAESGDDPDLSEKDRLIKQLQSVLEEQNNHRRWEISQSATMLGGLMDRMMKNDEKKDARISMYEQRFLGFLEAAEQALSRADDRRMAREQHEFKLDMLRHAGSVVMQLMPVVAKKLEGKATTASDNALLEVTAIKTFMDGLSPDQARALFGILGPGDKLAGGIFSDEQSKVFIGVHDGSLTPAALPRLFAGGDLAIGMEQLFSAKTVLSLEQVAPLIEFFGEKIMNPALNNGAQTSAQAS